MTISYVVLACYALLTGMLMFCTVAQLRWRQQARTTGDDGDVLVNIGKIAEQLDGNKETLGDLITMIGDVDEQMPRKVLAVVQGSINPRKGKIGELITMLELNSEYERLIPLGQPIDFIGIGTEYIDFIEVKTGNGRLTENERKIKTMVDNGKVRFTLIKTKVELPSGGE